MFSALRLGVSPSPGNAGIRPAMKKITLLNLYLAVLENGGPRASLRRKPLPWERRYPTGHEKDHTPEFIPSRSGERRSQGFAKA